MGFGDFKEICAHTPLPLCSLIGDTSPITGTHYTQTLCYSRTIELANTMIFQGAAGFAHIIALIMTVIMIVHVRSKFTAVGAYNFIPSFKSICGNMDTWMEANEWMIQAAKRSPPSSTPTPS